MLQFLNDGFVSHRKEEEAKNQKRRRSHINIQKT